MEISGNAFSSGLSGIQAGQRRVEQAASEIAAKEVERQRAGHYPTLDAVANYGRNNRHPPTPPKETTSISSL